MKSWSILRTLSAIDLQGLWMTKDVDLSESYSSSTPPTSLMSLLNGTLQTPFMLVTLLKLLIQSNHHLLGKGTPRQNRQSSMMKTRQSEHLMRSWIHDIQNQAVVFNIKFTGLIVILILSGIMQIMMSFRTCWKLYKNIMHNTLTNQICSLLNQSWFIISQQGQNEGKSRMQFQRLFQTHYSFLTESSFQEHGFWALRTKLMLKTGGNVGGSSSLKQCLPCWSNITAVVFPKQLKLSVINHAHSALTSFEIRLAYVSF